jgi:hypothetical protein
MSRRRVRALFRRVVQEIRRDRPSLGLLFIAPILVTGLVTFILREGEAPMVDAVVVNEAGAPGSSRTRCDGTGGGWRHGHGRRRTRRPPRLVRDGSASVAITRRPGSVGTA